MQEIDHVRVATVYPHDICSDECRKRGISMHDHCMAADPVSNKRIRKLADIGPINTPLSHQLESYNTLKYQRNIYIFGHKMILSAQF